MVEGKSYLQLYYNKACTNELEKDVEGNYIYNSNNISTNAIRPFIINLWCKNNGSHIAYRVKLENVSSILDITLPPVKEKIYAGQIFAFPIILNIATGDNEEYVLGLRFNYDSI